MSIRVFIALTDVQTLVEKILIDDSFYEFSISRSIANGKGTTYNGIDRTNSIHPLWIFLITIPFFLTKNIYLAVNIILLFASVIDAFTLLIIFKLTEKIFNSKTAFLTSMLYGLNPFIIFQILSGMEVVVSVFFVMLSMYVYFSLKDRLTIKKAPIIGLVLGLSILARWDNVFLLIAILFCIFWDKRENLMVGLSLCIIIGSLAVLAFSPFLLWNFLNFGKITLNSYTARYYMNHGIFPFFDLKPPTSFSDNLKLILENTYRGLGIILHQFGVINFDFLSPTALFPIFIATVFLFSVKHMKKLKVGILYAIFIFSFYCFYFLGVQIRYFTPFMPIAFILFSIGLQNFCEKFFNNKYILGTIFLFFMGLVIWNATHQWNMGYFSWQREIYKDALWLRENTTDSDVIGCFSSGIPTYFSEKRVVNLDGVLNAEAIEALRNKSVIPYMKSKNITIWIDSVYFNQTVANAYKNGLRFNVLENNLWKDFLGEGKENLILIEQREGIYKHLRGFEMLVIFFKAKVI
ncbi:MAG: glycosyltransferase family 39 protein [Candidatus Aenigmatarchaeota archaeon]